MLSDIMALLKFCFARPKLLIKYNNADIKRKIKMRYAKEGDAGLDLYYAGDVPITINAGESIEVPAGISIKIPDGYVGLLRCRSSTFAKRGLFIVHNTIDSGFVGDMFTHVWHPGIKGKEQPQVIEPWDRLSQIIIVPYLLAKIIVVSEMPSTERGSSGFGSSGR